MSDYIEEDAGGKWYFATSTRWGSAYQRRTYKTRAKARAAQAQARDDGLWVCTTVRRVKE